MSYIAPAGTPVRLGEIAGALTGASAAAEASVCSALGRVSSLPAIWTISSGRAAMTTILQAMRAARGDDRRDEVIVPAYTCYSVPAAIQRAGLKPRLCDIDEATLGMDPAVLERRNFSRTLAVVSANLYGLPNDLERIEAICETNGVYLLDDAAQALGATLNGRAVGAFGDAGLYSFDKGKIISTMQGGAIACRQLRLASELDALISALPGSAAVEMSANFLRLVVYAVFLRPALYGVVRRLPFTGLGHTRYEPRYPITRLSGFQCGVAARLLNRLAELNASRRARAREFRDALTGMPGLQMVLPLPTAEAAYARFPIRVTEPETRDRVLASLDRAGIGATASYPLALADVPEVSAQVPAPERDCPVARRIAQTIVTLPTHGYCKPDTARRVRAVLAECLR